MKSIGIRVEPKQIYYVIIYQHDDINEVLDINKLIIPKAFNIPDRLNFVRKTIIDIIIQYGITNAGIRITENNAKSINIERVSIEAVIQELFSSCCINNYFAGTIPKIAKLLDLCDSKDLKNMIDGKGILDEILFIQDLKNKEREAAFCALAAMNI